MSKSLGGSPFPGDPLWNPELQTKLERMRSAAVRFRGVTYRVVPRCDYRNGKRTIRFQVQARLKSGTRKEWRDTSIVRATESKGLLEGRDRLRDRIEKLLLKDKTRRLGDRIRYLRYRVAEAEKEELKSAVAENLSKSTQGGDD